VSVNVHVFVLLPPLEHAPDQTASRPLDTDKVIDVPVVNEADPVLPTATLMPAGLDVTLSPLRPVAVTVNVTACPGGGGGGVTVSAALLVAPANAPEIVTVVEVLTAAVVTLNIALAEPAATVTLAGTVAIGVLLLESVTVAPPVGAAAVSVAVPCTAFPPTTVVGLSVMLDRDGEAGAAAGWNVRTADHAPAVPAELIPRTRHECCTPAKPPVVNADGVTTWSITSGSVNVLESST
jgi:hypothetical protein